MIEWLFSIEDIQGPLDPELRGRIMRHYRHYVNHDPLGDMAMQYWMSDCVEDLVGGNGYLSELPQEIAHNLLNFIYGKFFFTFRHFFGSSNFRYDICYHFQPRIFIPDEDIIS
jgi:hypothetical protein